MTATMLATVGHGSAALWYLTRATGLVSLILLSATVVLGTVASVGWTSDRWPRFLSQSVHRNLSLFSIVLIGVHVVTTIGDGYVPIGLADAIIPFRSPYRPVWVGLGAVAFDMLLAVGITSAVRRRIGVAVWRGVHWLAYACWPIAVLHGLGSGSDPELPGATAGFRPLHGCRRRRSGLAPGGRMGAFSDLADRWRNHRRRGPGGDHGLRCRWSARVWLVPPGRHFIRPPRPTVRRAVGVVFLDAGLPTNPPATSASSGIPSTPFETTVSGTVSTSPPTAGGDAEVTLRMALADTSVPLRVRIIGPAINGGVQMRSSDVSFGQLSGQVTALQGSTIGALVTGPNGPLQLSMNLSLNPGSGTLTGQLSGSAAR